MFCCMLLYVHSSIAIILMGKRELIALLNLSSWCLVMVERLFLAVPRGCLQFVIVVFPDILTIFDLDPESICIERIHRIGRRQQPGRTLANQATQNIHGPLIALFRDYQDVELILSNAGKLRGKQFCINLDYPQEIINARKPLLALKRDLKSQDPSSRILIQYPA